jgi:amino acid transporter
MGWTFLGFEAAGSIAEEVRDPARNVPRAIVGVMISIGAITVFVTMASILAIPDIPAAMTGNIADPVIQSVTFHLGSGWEKPILLLIAMGFIGSMVALHTAGSRALYSLARDRLIPGADFFTKLTPSRKLPATSLAFTTLVAILVLLINIGAEKVFSTLLTIAVAGFFISYAFPIMSQAILQRQGRHVAGPFTLGKWSRAITLIASVWIVLELINVWWPRYPDLPWYQNWGVLLVTVILTVAGVIAYAFAPRHEMSGGGPAQVPPSQDVTTVPDATMSE